jgi:hypothetical protein
MPLQPLPHPESYQRWAERRERRDQLERRIIAACKIAIVAGAVAITCWLLAKGHP